MGCPAGHSVGCFRRPSQSNRTFKFVRAAYIWLLISWAADFVRYDAVLPALWSAHAPGVRAHVYGISPARLHRRLYQHDDPGSLCPRGSDPGWRRREKDELLEGTVCVVASSYGAR
jgi:hypothetical protein